jgi:leucyl aminopeptidase
MQINAKNIDVVKHSTQCLVLGCLENGALSSSAKAINTASAQQLEKLLKREKFSGKIGQCLLLLNPTGIAAERLLLLGLGSAQKDSSITPENFRKASQKIPEALKNTHCKELTIALADITVNGQDAQWQARQISEIFITSQHRSDGLKSKPAELSFVPTQLTLDVRKSELSSASKGIEIGKAIAQGVNFARELGNLPANICTPTYLASEAKRLARGQTKLSVKVLEEKAMRELGMGSLLSVSAGSDQPAKLIVMHYEGANKKSASGKKAAPIVLVGKGITFDTGGISLKPGAGMDEMKFDMCGAASVLGTMKTLLELKLPINVIGIIAASENMPNGSATKPGDIVTSMSGQTIEILNTDAEGRLVLCDALTYSERFKPKVVIDIATLTGACVIALGNHASGLFSNNDALSQALVKAGQDANDRAWPMPLWDDYQKQLDSNFADIANIGGREAGSITAACFLSRFTKKFAWAHLDIAGTAWVSGSAKGATGRPVPLLVQYLLDNQ